MFCSVSVVVGPAVGAPATGAELAVDVDEGLANLTTIRLESCLMALASSFLRLTPPLLEMVPALAVLELVLSVPELVLAELELAPISLRLTPPLLALSFATFTRSGGLLELLEVVLLGLVNVLPLEVVLLGLVNPCVVVVSSFSSSVFSFTSSVDSRMDICASKSKVASWTCSTGKGSNDSFGMLTSWRVPSLSTISKCTICSCSPLSVFSKA